MEEEPWVLLTNKRYIEKSYRLICSKKNQKYDQLKGDRTVTPGSHTTLAPGKEDIEHHDLCELTFDMRNQSREHDHSSPPSPSLTSEPPV